MQPGARQSTMLAALALAAMTIAGCNAVDTSADQRPPEKPEQVIAQAAKLGGTPNRASLSLARISTKSGEILILEPDGSVSTMQLDTAEGISAFQATEAQIRALESKVDPAVFKAGFPMTQTAQQRALDDFAAQTLPMLPDLPADTIIDPEDFLGARIATLNPKGNGDLVEIYADLRDGVDAEIAFSYAICALADVAKQKGAGYGRHIRTLQTRKNGQLTLGSAFILSSEQPLGLRVMKTNETLRECKARGIPAA